MIRQLLCFSSGLLFCTSALAQSPAPPASPAPGVTSAAGSDVEAFQKIEDKWDDAVNNRDQYGLELVLSPLFVGVSASGDITTRNQELSEVIGDQDKTMHIEQRIVTVRMLGDTAVANGTYSLHHKAASGAVDEKGVFTQVFQRQRNGWVCINSQRTILREDGPAAKGKKKQSNPNDLPFHIPIFTKDKQ